MLNNIALVSFIVKISLFFFANAMKDEELYV